MDSIVTQYSDQDIVYAYGSSPLWSEDNTLSYEDDTSTEESEQGTQIGINQPDLPVAYPRSWQILPIRTRHSPQTTIVLDMDETLIHSTIEPKQDVLYDFVLDIPFAGSCVRVHVGKRPYLDYFLEQVTSKFEVVVYTASSREYARAVMASIDPTGKIRYKIFRDN